ncbi:hypothetical protein [Sinorhizobium fredii]|uniref:hypothetical protein n=1 Tax=Rhizobium fredii TaxID=380 RepID=UPI00339821D2
MGPTIWGTASGVWIERAAVILSAPSPEQHAFTPFDHKLETTYDRIVGGEMAFNSGVYDPHRKPDKVTENKKREKERQEFFEEFSEANPNGKPIFKKGERSFTLIFTKSVGNKRKPKKTNKKKILKQSVKRSKRRGKIAHLF